MIAKIAGQTTSVGAHPGIPEALQHEHAKQQTLPQAQLVEQGQAQARSQVDQIVDTVRQRAGRGELNRGLSLSIPYFDDQAKEIRLRDFQVTPPGRFMFAPVFVTHAAMYEASRVRQDTHLSPSTRDHLVELLEALALAFITPNL